MFAAQLTVMGGEVGYTVYSGSISSHAGSQVDNKDT